MLVLMMFIVVMGVFRDSVAVAGGILGIIVFLGGLAAYFTGSYNKARIDALRQDLVDAANREEQHEKDRLADSIRIEALEREVEHLKQENDILRELATQRAATEALKQSMDTMANEMRKMIRVLSTHHSESVSNWQGIKRAVEKHGA